MKFIYLLILIFIFSSCQQKNPKEDKNLKISHSLQIKYARWFKVDYLKDYKRITVINPWTKDIYWEYHLYKSKIESKNTDKLSIISSPTNSAVLSGTQIAMFDKLKIIDKISAVANAKYIYNPNIRTQVQNGKIEELGDASTLNIEKAYLNNSDIIFATAWDKIDPKFEKLLAQNKSIAFVMDWQEQSPLARAEWIKFVAVFYNLEGQASSIFDSIENNYLSLSKLAHTSSNKPTVFHGTPMSGTWYIAGGKSFPAQFYKDANADYLWKNDSTTGSLPLSFEAVFNKAKSADFWFNTSGFSTRSDFYNSDQRYALFNSYKNNSIYSNGEAINAKIPSPFWELGTVNPDLVLKDIISIIHPQLLPNHKLMFYRKLN